MAAVARSPPSPREPRWRRRQRKEHFGRPHSMGVADMLYDLAGEEHSAAAPQADEPARERAERFRNGSAKRRGRLH